MEDGLSRESFCHRETIWPGARVLNGNLPPLQSTWEFLLVVSKDCSWMSIKKRDDRSEKARGRISLGLFHCKIRFVETTCAPSTPFLLFLTVYIFHFSSFATGLLSPFSAISRSVCRTIVAFSSTHGWITRRASIVWKLMTSKRSCNEIFIVIL